MFSVLTIDESTRSLWANYRYTTSSILRTITGWPIKKLLILIPAKTGIILSKKEVLGKNQIPKTLLINLARGHVPLTMRRIKTYSASPELWLGVIFGVGTRIVSRFVLATAFTSTQGVLSIAAGFVVCAGAGVVGGMAAYLVCVHYRNSRRVRGKKKEIYLGKAFLESAVIGLLGGAIGGFAMNAGSLIAKAGRAAIGASAGIAGGILHTGIREYKASHGSWNARDWKRLATRGTAFGAIGGMIGVVFVDLFGAHESVAAPTDQTGWVTPTSQAPIILIPPAAPAESVTLLTPQVACPVVAAPQTHCVHHHSVHHYKHLHHHAKHHIKKPHVTPPPPPIIQNFYFIQQPAPLPPPMTVPQPMMTPAPMDPCSTGDCRPPCDPHSELDIKGPCGDPDTPCVERVSFNDDGDATKVVLEPQSAQNSTTHFETNPSKIKGTNWSHAARNTTLASNSDADASNVSLVVPFGNHAAMT